MKEYKIGDKIITKVEGIIIDKDDTYGLYYKIVLPKNDFILDRIIWVNEDEIKQEE